MVRQMPAGTAATAIVRQPTEPQARRRFGRVLPATVPDRPHRRIPRHLQLCAPRPTSATVRPSSRQSPIPIPSATRRQCVPGATSHGFTTGSSVGNRPSNTSTTNRGYRPGSTSTSAPRQTYQQQITTRNNYQPQRQTTTRNNNNNSYRPSNRNSTPSYNSGSGRGGYSGGSRGGSYGGGRHGGGGGGRH